jgi:ABC-type glycerol-3-phosphate transport system permease component
MKVRVKVGRLSRPKRNWKEITVNQLSNLTILVFAIFWILPIAWLLITSIQIREERFQIPPKWIPSSVEFSAYKRAWDLFPIAEQFLNSLKVATLSTLGALIISSLAAYAFARLNFFGREPLFLIILAGMMIPPQLTVIPSFIAFRKIGLIDNHAALFLPAMISPLGIFLLRQFFRSIPRELDESAKIDGAGPFRIFFQIILPLSKPAISALAVVLFIASWNDFFWPNIFISTSEKMTLPVGIASLVGVSGNTNVLLVMASVGMQILPLLVIFLFTQRFLIQSIATTGIRG